MKKTICASMGKLCEPSQRKLWFVRVGIDELFEVIDLIFMSPSTTLPEQLIQHGLVLVRVLIVVKTELKRPVKNKRCKRIFKNLLEVVICWSFTESFTIRPSQSSLCPVIRD